MFREVRLDISERTLKSREELERSPKLRTKGVESGPLVGPPPAPVGSLWVPGSQKRRRPRPWSFHNVVHIQQHTKT